VLPKKRLPTKNIKDIDVYFMPLGEDPLPDSFKCRRD